jgi:hypothetical protein
MRQTVKPDEGRPQEYHDAKENESAIFHMGDHVGRDLSYDEVVHPI